MPYAAQIDRDNKVIFVMVVPEQSEMSVEEWCEIFAPAAGLATDGTYWKRTSLTGRIRNNFAGVGFTYDPVRDAFIPPKPDDSAEFDEERCQWIFTDHGNP